jgi:hypothetical protein
VYIQTKSPTIIGGERCGWGRQSVLAWSFAKPPAVVPAVKSLLVFLLVIASASATPIKPPKSRVLSPLDITHATTRAEIVKLMASPVIDSFLDRDARGRTENVLVFAPIHIIGVNSIAHVRLIHDTLVQTDFYLPYRPRRGVKPAMPYGAQRFTRATLEDLVKLRASVVKLYGEPSVMAETSFIYFEAPAVPYMTAIFKDQTILLSIFPAEKH